MNYFGGNSGYSGYSMSNRAVEAREGGRFPKTDFKKVYGIDNRVLDVLVDLKVIDNTEWHHTSKYGNKTPFYSWVDDDYLDVWQQNKSLVKQLVQDNNFNELANLFGIAYDSLGTDDIRVGDILRIETCPGVFIEFKILDLLPNCFKTIYTEYYNDKKFEREKTVDRYTISLYDFTGAK